MFTDDVLCCLKYGDVWGIDETVIEIRGSSQKQDAAIMEEFEKRHGRLRRDDPKAYDGEWEKARERSVRSAYVSAKKWLTGVIDHKTRAIVHHIITGPEARAPGDIQPLQGGRERRGDTQVADNGQVQGVLPGGQEAGEDPVRGRAASGTSRYGQRTSQGSAWPAGPSWAACGPTTTSLRPRGPA